MIKRYWRRIRTGIENIPHKGIFCFLVIFIAIPGLLFSFLYGRIPGMMLCASLIAWIWKAIYHHELVEDTPMGKMLMLLGGLQRMLLLAAMLFTGMAMVFLVGIAVIQAMMTMAQNHSMDAGEMVSPIFWLIGCGVNLAAAAISIEQENLVCLYPLGISFALACLIAFTQRTALKREMGMRFHTA